MSSPTDFPRAYICDECVRTCMMILEDDRASAEEAAASEGGHDPHPLLSHPLASELMSCFTAWITQESLGQPAFTELNRLRELASRMLEDHRV